MQQETERYAKLRSHNYFKKCHGHQNEISIRVGDLLSHFLLTLLEDGDKRNINND